MTETVKQVFYRQGDILFFPDPTLTTESYQVKRGRQVKDGVIAKGETTGHAHRISRRNLFATAGQAAAMLFALPGNMMALLAPESVTIEHDEHGPVTLPPGAYRIEHQREYDPLGPRAVYD